MEKNIFDAGENEKRAEDIKHPVKLADERHAGGDHRAAHHQRAENAPEQEPVLEFRRHAEPGEDERDDQDVVERERKLDDVAGGECLGLLAPAPENHRAGKRMASATHSALHAAASRNLTARARR